MSSDIITRALNVVRAQGTRYLDYLARTLWCPRPIFQHHIVPNVLAGGSGRSTLNPELLVFCVVSISLGYAVNSLTVPNMKLASTFTVALLCWLSFAVLEAALCKVLAGRGSSLDTVAVVLQVNAAAYVVSSVLTFLGTIVVYWWLSTQPAAESEHVLPGNTFQRFFQVWLDPYSIKIHDVMQEDAWLYGEMGVGNK